MKKVTEDLIAHAVIFGVMLVLYLESRSIPDMNIGGSLGAEWWPQVVLGLGMLLTIASAVFAVKDSRATPEGKSKVTLAELKSLSISGAIFIVFLVAIDSLGFLGAVPLLVFGFMYQLGARNPVSLILISVLSSPIFAVVFGRLMEVPLPRGSGLARILSFHFF